MVENAKISEILDFKTTVCQQNSNNLIFKWKINERS